MWCNDGDDNDDDDDDDDDDGKWIQDMIKVWYDDDDEVFANRMLQKINTALGSFSTNQVKKLNQNYILHKQIKASGNSQS